MTTHELAKRLLQMPDAEVIVVKPEGEGYVSEYDLHPGGPWTDGAIVRVAIERRMNGVQAG